MDATFKRFWPWFLFAAAFESLVAILLLLSIPSEDGISSARAGLLAILLLFLISGAFLGILARRDVSRFDAIPRRSVILGSAMLALVAGLLLFLLRYLNPEQLMPYYERLSPVLWYLALLGIQSSVFLLLLKHGFHPHQLAEERPVYRAGIIIFLIFMLVLVFIWVTKIGIKPDTGYWGEPGVAVQGWQAGASILAGFFVFLLGMNGGKEKALVFNLLIPVGLYAAACILWLGVPLSVLENSFYAPITPPANLPFPYSDAAFYDYLSQSLLIGTDYLGGIPPRPLYVLFLGVLHFIFGQNYPAMIATQTLLLAFFPVALYFIGKRLHSPAAGTVAAWIAIFRELVGLWISSNTRVANSKIFTTDFPTALGIAILCLIVIWWIERRDLKSTLVAGCAFGLLLLLRTQSLFTLLAVMLVTWFVYRHYRKQWLQAIVVFSSALLLTILPWLGHNYTITGKFSFDDPSQMAILYSQYSFSGNLDLSQFDPQKESLGNRLVKFTLENPGYVSTFVLSHFLNTEIGGLLALPLVKPFGGLSAPINLYWVGWDGSLEWYNAILILFYLGVIAFGIGAAWRRRGWMGLVPLAFNAGYALANGISRFSSWRYNLPVDWVVYFYFAIGVIEIFAGFSLTLNFNAPSSMENSGVKSFALRDFRPAHLIILLVFVAMGASPWMAKAVAVPWYVSTREDLIGRLEAGGYSAAALSNFLGQSNAVLEEGMILYPRMYRRGLGMSSANPWPAYEIREYPRIGFVLLNDHQIQALFKTRELLDIPHGADAIMLGCQADGFVDVRLLVVEDRAFQSAPLKDSCE